MEIVAEVRDLEAVRRRNARDVLGHDVQQHDALVQHLVVLEIVQQRHRHDVDAARHIDGGAAHARLVVDLGDEVRQAAACRARADAAARLRPCRQVDIRKKISAATTSGNQPPSKHLHHVGGDERQVDDDEQAGDGERRAAGSSPRFPASSGRSASRSAASSATRRCRTRPRDCRTSGTPSVRPSVSTISVQLTKPT